MAQARFFAGRHFVFDLERRRLRIVQNVQARGHHFHFARRDFRIRLLAANHLPFDRDHKLRTQLFGLFVRLGMQLFVEHNLRNAGTVAQINEDQLAQIAAAMHPAHQDHVSISIRLRADRRSNWCVSGFREYRARLSSLPIVRLAGVRFSRRGSAATKTTRSAFALRQALIDQPRLPRFSDSRYSSRSYSESFF